MQTSRPLKRARVERSATPSLKRAIRTELARVGETKHYDVQLSAAGVFPSIPGGAWTEVLATFIGQGSAQNTRVGSKIAVTGLKVHGMLNNGWTSGVGGDAYNQVRCVVYDGNSGSAGRLATMGSTINAVVRGDSVTGINRLYKDMWIPLNPGYGEETAISGIAGGPLTVPVSFYLHFKKPIVIDYSGGANTGNHGLWIAFISDSGAVPHPGFTAGYFSCSYKDL